MHGRARALLYIELLGSTALHTRRVCVETFCACVCVSVCVNIKRDRLRKVQLIKFLHNVLGLAGTWHISETTRQQQHN